MLLLLRTWRLRVYRPPVQFPEPAPDVVRPLPGTVFVVLGLVVSPVFPLMLAARRLLARLLKHEEKRLYGALVVALWVPVDPLVFPLFQLVDRRPPLPSVRAPPRLRRVVVVQMARHSPDVVVTRVLPVVLVPVEKALRRDAL